MIRALLFFITLALPLTLVAAEVQNIRIGDHVGKTRVVIDMTGEMDFQAKLADSPKQLIIHLPAKNFNVGGRLSFAKPFTSIAHTQTVDNLLKLSMPLSSPYVIQSAYMIGGAPNRLVIDMIPSNDVEFKNQLLVNHGPLKVIEKTQSLDNLISGIAGETPQPVPYKKPPSRKKPIIVIDAGHGGKDPGAISPSGIREKDITLPMARKIAHILNSSGRYEAKLTRNDDRYIKLYNRVKIARNADADMFISVHADSVGNSTTRGASVYTLSNTASDTQTAKLASRENKADLIGGLDLNIEDKDVSAILIDLSMRETMNQSKNLANGVVTNFRGNNIRTLKGPHRYAGFAVLKAPDVPSILIETGFVSNESEAKTLLSDAHQTRIATAILNTLSKHFYHD